MKRLTEKLPLMLMTLCAFGFTDVQTEPIILQLITVTVSLIVQYIGDKPVSWAMIGVMGLMSGGFPMLLCGMPILLYDALWLKKPWLMLFYLLSLLHAVEIGAMGIMITAAAAGTAVIMYFRMTGYERSIEHLLSMRDEAEVSNMKLIEKNYRLTEAQDNEVRLATLRERNRIAREIHDNVGHMLTRSLLQSGALIIINKDEKLNEPLQELKTTLDTAMTSIRQSVHDLHDESIDFDAVAGESIRAVSERFRVTYRNEAGAGLPISIRLCFLAVIKEALSNAVKHSNGDRIEILVREHPAFYQLSIEDNGECSEGMGLDTGGMGLQNMRDRAESMGGMINFIPSSKGFRILLNVPVQR